MSCLISHTLSYFERQKLPLGQLNTPPTQCTIREISFIQDQNDETGEISHHHTLSSPYAFITSSCTDMIRTSTTSMPYIKIQTEITHYVAISLTFLLTHVFILTHKKLVSSLDGVIKILILK